MQPDLWFSLSYWLIALVASALYGWHAVTIFIQPPQPGETRRPTAWVWHQRWLNFVGALVGWVALWFLFRGFGSCFLASCAGEFSGVYAVVALVAFIGITGYLPNTVVSLVAGVGALAGRLAEVIASWVAKK